MEIPIASTPARTHEKDNFIGSDDWSFPVVLEERLMDLFEIKSSITVSPNQDFQPE
jgi:hypothetical protein